MKARRAAPTGMVILRDCAHAKDSLNFDAKPEHTYLGITKACSFCCYINRGAPRDHPLITEKKIAKLLAIGSKKYGCV